jgi:hypothetical protein
MPSNEAGRRARRNGYRVRWRNSDWKTPCGAEGDPEKVPDTFSPFARDSGLGVADQTMPAPMPLPEWLGNKGKALKRS